MKLIKASEISARILTLLDESDESDERVIIVSPYIKIHHLHSKLYLNEKYGIVRSMNLLLSSEINSLEIGYAADLKEITHRIKEDLEKSRRYYHHEG